MNGKPGVLASLDQAKAALSQNATFPADVSLALTAMAEARATVERLAAAAAAHLGFNECDVTVPDGAGFYSERRYRAVAEARDAVENELRAALAAFRGDA